MSKMAEMAYYAEQERMREEMEMAEAEWTGAVECFEHTSGGGLEDPVVARTADETAFADVPVGPTLEQQLDAQRPLERDFRIEVGKDLRRHKGGTMRLSMAVGLKRGIEMRLAEWGRERRRKKDAEERLAMSWPVEGPMTGETDYTPEGL